MSEKEQIEFLGFSWSAKAILRDPFHGAAPQEWTRDSLGQRCSLLQSTGAPLDVTERILAEWPEAPPTMTERERRLERKLCEIADAARSPLCALDPMAMLKTIADEALLAIKEGNGE